MILLVVNFHLCFNSFLRVFVNASSSVFSFFHVDLSCATQMKQSRDDEWHATTPVRQTIENDALRARMCMSVCVCVCF